MDFSIFVAIFGGAYTALAVFFGYENQKYNRIEAELRKQIFPCDAR